MYAGRNIVEVKMKEHCLRRSPELGKFRAFKRKNCFFKAKNLSFNLVDHLTLVEIVLCVYNSKKFAIRPFPSAWCRETRVEENIRTRAYILIRERLLAAATHSKQDCYIR